MKKQSLEQLKNSHQNLFVQHPYSYWAKASDRVIHIPVNRSSGSNGTECGSHAALLGNNYAPVFKEKSIYPVPICPACLERIYYRDHLDLGELKTSGEILQALRDHYTGDYHKDNSWLIKHRDKFCTEHNYPIIINTGTGPKKASNINLGESFNKMKQTFKKNPR